MRLLAILCLIILGSNVTAEDMARASYRPGDPATPSGRSSPSAGRASPRSGRAVVSVGPETITLPEMIAAVKARLAEVPAQEKLDRRQTITLAKAVYKVVVVRSLVFQEARDVLGGPEPLSQMVKGLESRWDKRELPALIRREGSEAGLRSRLAKRATTPGLLRDEFIVRSLAENLMKLESPAGDLSSYLESVRRRRPIRQIMSEAELTDAGRDAAIEAGRTR